MKTISALMLAATLVVSGCATVDMEPPSSSAKTKEFNAPTQGKAGLYIYRDSLMGKMLKKDLWINGKCMGESGPDVFFTPKLMAVESTRLKPNPSSRQRDGADGRIGSDVFHSPIHQGWFGGGGR